MIMKEHEDALNQLYQQLKPIFDKSEQAVYLYLDDNHAKFSKKFSKLLGYEGTAIPEANFLNTLVAKKSRDILVSSYEGAAHKLVGSCIRVNWKKKNNTELETSVIMVPITYGKYVFVMHFIREV